MNTYLELLKHLSEDGKISSDIMQQKGITTVDLMKLGGDHKIILEPKRISDELVEYYPTFTDGDIGRATTVGELKEIYQKEKGEE